MRKLIFILDACHQTPCLGGNRALDVALLGADIHHEGMPPPVTGEQFRLFTVRPDGTDLRRITTPGGATNPDWSPDGRMIAFGLEKATTAGVAVMNANGKQLRTLTPTGFQGQPSFSPDGQKLAVTIRLAVA